MSTPSLQSASRSGAPLSSTAEHLSSPTSSIEDESISISHPAWSSNQPPLGSPQTPSSPGAIGPSASNANSSNNNNNNSVKSSNPMQKRRRVTRACDTCRSKKIKCDGKQPCTHCTVYSYDCTYDQPSNRRRNPAPQYIEALENKLQRMEALLKIVLPDVDVNNSNFDPGTLTELKQRYDRAATKEPPGNTPMQIDQQAKTNRQDALLETMVEAAGRLDIDERGHVDFHGHSSGFTFLHKLREEFGDLLGQDASSSTFLRLRAPNQGTLESPRSTTESPKDPYNNDATPLPPRAVAQDLVNYCLNEACIFFRFIHRPSFDTLFDTIYNTDPEDYGTKEYRFLPLLYLAMAVGCVFAPADQYGTADGMRWFLAGRRLVEVTDCRDITSIQCVILMILFLQSSAKLATCYSFVSIALSASVRMGMHRKFSRPNPIECELRKRIFWTIRKMDTYVATLLGLPRGIQDEDIDQEYPLEIDDEYITPEGVLTAPEGARSSLAAANAHTKLLKILGKLVKYIYPIKGLQPSGSGKRSGYMVTYAAIREIEEELDKWQDDLPMFLRPGDDAPVRFTRSQHLLRMSLAHTKMMLYRPFLHYVAKPRDGNVGDERPYACAAACINVCREVVHICETMRTKKILNGAYWFNIYTTFFAIISLVYFVLENISHPDAPEILREATLGKDCILSVRGKSMAAERCSATLKGLFEQLPNRLKNGFENASVTKKKRARGVSPGPTSLGSTARVSSPFHNASVPSISATPNAFPHTPENNGCENSSRMMEDSPDISSNYELDENPYDLGNRANQSLDKAFADGISFQQHLGAAGGMPDLNALMFPTSENFGFASSSSQNEGSYKPLTSGELQGPVPGAYATSPLARQPSQAMQDGSPFPSLEVQLFGPYQPYFYQGQMGRSEMSTSPTSDQNAVVGFNMNLDQMFSSGLDQSGEWEDFLSKPSFRS